MTVISHRSQAIDAVPLSENMERCLFPVPILHGDVEFDSTHSICVDRCISATLRLIAIENEIELCHLLETAWAIVSQSYLAAEVLAFGSVQFSAFAGAGQEIAGTECNPWNIRTIKINPATSFVHNCRYLADAESTTHSHVAGSCSNYDLHFNTLVTMLDAEKVDLLRQSCRYDELIHYFRKIGLTVDFEDSGDLLSFGLTSHAIPQDQISRIALTIEHTLKVLSTSSNTALTELSFTSAQDIDELWNWNSKLPPAIDQTVFEVFEAQVSATPGGEAVRSWDGSLTYLQLKEYASKVATKLRDRLPVEPQIVPICFEKSKWTIVAMLAVLRAGHAFATLDPSQPINRLEVMTKEIGATLMLASPTQLGRFDNTGMILIANLEEICNSVDTSTQKFSTSSPDDLAYVLFTSGSTGTPKAVMHNHTAACTNMLLGTKLGSTGYGPGSRVLQFASQAFGASVWEVLKTLGQGGCICIPSEEQRLQNLSKFISDQRITRTFLVPSFLKLLSPDDVPSLEILTVGGEPVSPELIKIWAPKLRLIEAFGMTEGAAMVTRINPQGKRSRADQKASGAAWIVDPSDYCKLAPIGGIGGLVFEGFSLSGGYLGDQEKTDKAFRKSPTWMRAGRPQRVFRTGDLAQYDANGVIKILGRKDNRVKLNGQRIELGEVELHMQKRLSESCIVAAEVISLQGSGDAILVGFIGHPKGLSELTFNVPDLLHDMARALHSYMVPSFILPLEKVPLNASGKVDRKSLRLIASGLPRETLLRLNTSGNEWAPPATDMEARIRAIWAEVLRLEESKLSVSDNFYFLGGNSLLAIKLVTSARKIGLVLETNVVFGNPTIRDLSAAAKPARDETSTLSSAAKQEAEREGEMRRDYGVALKQFETYGVQTIAEATDMQSWSVYSGLLKSRGWSDYMLFDFQGTLSVSRLRGACRSLLRSLPTLRTVHFVEGRKIFQVTLKNPPFEFLEYDLPKATSLEAFSRTLFELDMHRTAKIGDPYVRFLFVKQDRFHARLIMRISHSSYDAVSLPILWEAFKAAYLGKETAPAPSVMRVSQALTPANVEASKVFWRDLLAGSEVTPLLPHATPTYQYPLNSNTMASVSLPHLEKNGISTATLVTTAWSYVLSMLSGRSNVVFGTITSGRHDFSTASLMGACWNVVPVRTMISHSDTIISLLQKVQTQQLAAIPHESLGFRHIIEECTDWKNWTRFSSIVNHVNVDIDEAALSITEQLKYKFGIFEPANDKADLWLLTAPQSDGSLSVEIKYCKELMSEDMSNNITRYFCQVLESLAANLKNNISDLPKKPWGNVSDLFSKHASEQHRSRPASIDVRIGNLATRVVENAWKTAFGFRPKAGTYTESFGHEIPFYEVWGDLIGAAALSQSYEQEGFYLSVEDIIENPTMSLQMRLCSIQEADITTIEPSVTSIAPKPEPLRITIIGGGLGGAIAARILRPFHHVTILERSPSAVELGAAINIGPNNVKFLTSLGFDRENAGCCRLGYTQTWAKDGRLLHEESLEHTKEFEEDWLAFHRADLRNEFLRLATEDSMALSFEGQPANMRFASEVREVDCETGDVKTSNGEVFKSDIVIGADGINSIVRPIVLAGQHFTRPKPSGMSIFRFALEAEEAIKVYPDLPRDKTKGASLGMILSLDGTKRSVVIYPCRNFEQFNFGALIPDDMLKTCIPSVGNMTVGPEGMVELFSDFPPWMLNLMKASKNVQLWQIRHQDPLPTYVRGRVVLVGDAAHAMTPLQGQGANQAIEDAEGLKLLNTGHVTRENVHEVLKEWERVRLPRASRVQDISMEAISNMNASNAYSYCRHYWNYPGITGGLKRLDRGEEIVAWEEK